MLKLSTKVALAALISISALSTADASKNSYEESFMQEAESIQYRTNRSGLVRSQPIKISRFDKNVKKAIWKSKYATTVSDEEAEETQPTGMIYTVINFVTNLFWRS